MLKLIIADDEALVRSSLQTLIDWKSYGIEILALAAHGEEAYQLCAQLNPDILITDIKMPFMDGLEVATKLKEENFPVKIIIISGISDFSYAKTALEINVEDYILKPIKIKELQQVIKKVVTTIDIERNKALYVSTLKQQLKENLFLARERFLINFITGNSKNHSNLDERLAYYKVPFKSYEALQVCLLEIDQNNLMNLPEEDYQLILFSVDNITNEIINNYEAGMMFTLIENQFVIIFNESLQSSERLTQICEEILNFINKILDITITIGIGIPVIGIKELNTSYVSASKALQYKFYTGGNSILNIMDFETNYESDDAIKHVDWFALEDELFKNIQLGNEPMVLETIDDIFYLMNSIKSESIEYVQNLCFEVLLMISRKLFELDENLEHIINNHNKVIELISQQKTLVDLKTYFTSVCMTITQYFSNKYNQKNLKVIQSIKTYIDNNYMIDISVSKIADEIYLSPNYISLIFKQSTGETIIDYLTRIRISKAKELLKSPDLKIFEVSELVGYPNPRYFSKVFKKATGLHPSQFKEI